jgi:predicted DNA-binding transcriptional regulator AlpA
MPNSGYLTIPDVCHLLGITPNTAYWYRHKNIGPPCSKIAGKIVYDADEFEQWYDNRLRQTRRGDWFPRPAQGE